MSSLAADEDEVILIDGTADRLDDETFFQCVRAHKSTASIVIFAVGSAAWSSDYNYLKQVRTIVEATPFFVIGDLLLEDFYQISVKPMFVMIVNSINLKFRPFKSHFHAPHSAK